MRCGQHVTKYYSYNLQTVVYRSMGTFLILLLILSFSFLSGRFKSGQVTKLELLVETNHQLVPSVLNLADKAVPIKKCPFGDGTYSLSRIRLCKEGVFYEVKRKTNKNVWVTLSGNQSFKRKLLTTG